MAAEVLELAGLAAALIGAGALIGVILGALGAGGGAAIAPLVFAVFSSFDYPLAEVARGAIATALTIVAILSARAMLSAERRAAIDPALLARGAPVAAMGAAAAAAAGALAPAWALLSAAALAVGLAGLEIALRPIKPGALGDARSIAGIGAFFGLGVASGVGGLGGGSGAPVLVGLGVDARRASATAAAVGAIAAGLAAAAYAALGPSWTDGPPLNVGPINLLAIALIAPAAIITAAVGARVSHALTLRPLSILIGLFLIASAFVMLRAAMTGSAA